MQNERELINLIKRYEDAVANGKSIYFDADVFADIIDYYDNDGDFDSAKEVLSSALKIHPASDILLLKKAKLLVYEEEYEKALNILEYALSGDDTEYLLVKIECLIQLERYEEAQEVADTVIANEKGEKGFHNLLFDLAYIYSEADLFEEAITLLKRSIEIFPENIDALSDLAYAYEMNGDFLEAIETTNKMLDIDPYNYETWVSLGKLYSLTDEYGKAADALDFALTINNQDRSIRKLRAHCLSLSGRPMEAMLTFKELLDETSEDTTLYLLLAECSTRLGLYNEALIYLDEYRKEEGETVSYIIKKASLLVHMDKTEQAIRIIGSALEKDNNVELLLLLANIKISGRDYRLAEQDLKEAYMLDSDNFEVIDRLSIVEINLENYEESIKYTEELLILEPDNRVIKQRLALLYFEIDDKEKFNEIINSFSDEDLMTFFSLFYQPQQPELFDRKLLLASLNDAREYRTLFKNLKY